METTKEEKKLLEKLKSGLLDGRVGRDLETSGGSTIWTMIKNGLPGCYKEGPGGRFFNGKENTRRLMSISVLLYESQRPFPKTRASDVIPIESSLARTSF